MVDLLDSYVGGFPLLLVGMIEIIVVVYVYGLGYNSEKTNQFPMSLLRGMYYTGGLTLFVNNLFIGQIKDVSTPSKSGNLSFLFVLVKRFFILNLEHY